MEQYVYNIIQLHVAFQQPKLVEAAGTVLQATVKKPNKTANEVFFSGRSSQF